MKRNTLLLIGIFALLLIAAMPKPGHAQGYEETPKQVKGSVSAVINSDTSGEPRVTFMPVTRQDNPAPRKKVVVDTSEEASTKTDPEPQTQEITFGGGVYQYQIEPPK